jgi:hypothetical protein
MERSTHILKDRETRHATALIVNSLPLGTKVEIGEETRTARQNRAIHGLIGQIIKQRPMHNGVRFSLEAYKAAFMAGLGEEARWVPNLDGTGMVPVGLSTSKLSVRKFNLLMEFIFAWCAREGLTIRHFDEFTPAAQEPGGVNSPSRVAA